MKKLCFLVLIVIQVSVYASGTQESWISVGGEYGHFIETQSPNGINIKTTLNSIGINLKDYTFKNDNNIGMFVHDSFLIPIGGKISSSGYSMDYSLSEADSRFHQGLMLGPVFRNKIDVTKDIYFALGSSLQSIVIGYPNGGSTISLIFGLGTDFGLKYNLTGSTFLDIGMTADYNFACYTFLNNDDGAWVKNNYSNISFRPQIGIGTILKKEWKNPF